MKLCVVIEPAERRVIVPGMTYQFTAEELAALPSVRHGERYSILLQTITMLRAAAKSLQDEANGEIEKLSIG